MDKLKNLLHGLKGLTMLVNVLFLIIIVGTIIILVSAYRDYIHEEQDRINEALEMEKCAQDMDRRFNTTENMDAWRQHYGRLSHYNSIRRR